MKKIIFVPGKNPKPPEKKHRQQLFRCLLHGVQHLNPDIASQIESSDCFSLVAWNRYFYDTERDISDDIPWIDKLIASDFNGETDIREARTIKYRIARFMYQAGDYLPWLIPLIPDQRVRQSIEETERYFRNHENIACKIRELQKQPLRDAVGNGDKVLLMGHSMGSIIAYDSLWELHHLEDMETCVDCLLTLGSPLGMNYVQKRLIGMNNQGTPKYPGNVRNWVNISSHGDLVALDPSLANDFAAMVIRQEVETISDQRAGIFNHYRDNQGLNVHKSYGYLVNPAVSQTIINWWSAT